MSYRVYLVSSAGAPLDHQAIFVETDTESSSSGSGSGTRFHVVGDIQNGMRYVCEATTEVPDQSFSFIGKELVGTVSHANYSRIDDVCGQIPPPKKQFDRPRRLYPSEPLRRCREWAAGTIQELKNLGVLEKLRVEDF